MYDFSYFGYEVMTFCWYTACYGNIGLIVIIMVMRYFQVVKGQIISFWHFLAGISATLFIPGLMNISLAKAFDQTVPLDIAYHFKLNGVYESDLFLPETKNLVIEIKSIQMLVILTLYTSYLTINYGVVIFTYITFKNYMKKAELTMSANTRRMNIEFNRVLLTQCASPLIVGGPLVFYIVTLIVSPIAIWPENGTFVITALAATPVINAFAFLIFSSKNRQILYNSLVMRLELVIMGEYLVFHLVYSYMYELSYYGYMVMIFCWYSTCYVTLILPALMNINLCRAFDETVPLDIAYQFKLNGTYESDLILANTKSLRSIRLYIILAIYTLYLSINYGIVVFTYLTFKRYMQEFEDSMTDQTKRMNIEFNRILLTQCASPLLVGVPLVIYIGSLATAGTWGTWNEGGTFIVVQRTVKF
uniref:G protein-coupled receptor n=1 Tax=Rhabditophanes sp. KR3021 TaxID=114890 RepID=A0AC35U1E4_9BILA